MSTRPARGSSSDKVTVYIRGLNAGSRSVSRRSIEESAMNNAKTSFEIEGHRYSDSDWSKIMRIADQLDAVI
ncbi:hypothetical protein WN53_20855 [Serratia fonticola]|uniref:hypothetical protein n=1 Tax=Serratia fonticola TaxID=47917 RepID=UPI000463B492|nr:hypothetical protein [Serratia fonticola]AKG71376.1 hypothetical protein WN53_20855 [Serratia fonticola]CAI1767230.1 Uncharacterised protein [Serratia fonticola]